MERDSLLCRRPKWSVLSPTSKEKLQNGPLFHVEKNIPRQRVWNARNPRAPSLHRSPQLRVSFIAVAQRGEAGGHRVTMWHLEVSALIKSPYTFRDQIAFRRRWVHPRANIRRRNYFRRSSISIPLTSASAGAHYQHCSFDTRPEVRAFLK